MPSHARIAKLFGLCSAQSRQQDDRIRWSGTPLATCLITKGHVLDALAVTHHARVRVRAVLLAIEGRGVARHGVVRLPRWRDVLAVRLTCG
ncbi:hypothetical protein XapnCFBP3894_17235 [Xanthomonas arboricola pv. pruni]|nr:hypothetical protein XapnCFBP3894_17235 [Xanthomonas arboricola pv. pruni]